MSFSNIGYENCKEVHFVFSAQAVMSSLPRKRLKTDSPPQLMVDPNKCIICQTTIPDQHTSSTENGMAKIIHAAGVRKDIIFQRLKQIDHGTIVYHVSNHCYKHYTHAKSLQKSSPAASNQSLPKSVSSIPCTRTELNTIYDVIFPRPSLCA